MTPITDKECHQCETIKAPHDFPEDLAARRANRCIDCLAHNAKVRREAKLTASDKERRRNYDPTPADMRRQERQAADREAASIATGVAITAAERPVWTS